MERWRRWWKGMPKPIRQPLVLVCGSLVVLGGIVLLPLPGPGWPVIFFGFAILATEFTFAEKVRNWLIAQFKKLFKWSKKILQRGLNLFKHKQR